MAEREKKVRLVEMVGFRITQPEREEIDRIAERLNVVPSTLHREAWRRGMEQIRQNGEEIRS